VAPRADFSTWADDRLRRSAFFFRSGADRLYASWYEAVSWSGLPPLLIAPSWGRDFEQTLEFAHNLAAATALAGGSALVHHPPGLGDSYGDPALLSIDRMTEAVSDAARELTERGGGNGICLVGVRLGAQVAAYGWERIGPTSLLLVQPVLDDRAAATAFARLGAPAPVAAEDARRRLERFPGPAGSVHHPAPPPGSFSPGLEVVVVAGDWRRGQPPGGALVPRILQWLRSAHPRAA
jgi:hypothetical protein